MEFLSSLNISTLMSKVCEHLSETKISGQLKQSFFETLNDYQKIELKNFDSRKVEFLYNERLVFDFLQKAESISKELSYEDTVLARPQDYYKKIEEGIEYIKSSSEDLYLAITSLISNINVCGIPGKDGGSVSNGIGLIFMCPRPGWSSLYIGEMIVHEFTHNVLFLEDLANEIFPDYELLKSESGMAVSAIRMEKREFDKTYHSAVVAASLVKFYQSIDRPDLAEPFIVPTERAIMELDEAYDRVLNVENKQIITQRGVEILNQTRSVIFEKVS